MLFRRRAVFAAVSFSKVTLADLVSPSGLTSRLVILPLEGRLGMLDVVSDEADSLTRS